MTDTITCEHCNVILKNKYNLKAHLNNNKTCLSKRNISLNDKFTCNGCDSIFTLKTNFTKHINTCKSYNKVIKEQKEIKEKEYNENSIIELKTLHEKELNNIKQSYERKILELRAHYERTITEIKQTSDHRAVRARSRNNHVPERGFILKSKTQSPINAPYLLLRHCTRIFFLLRS